MEKIVLTDSCYWLGLVDSEDQHHETSKAIRNLINDFKIKVPWPCMFESVSTHLIRNRKKTLLFENYINESKVELYDDEKYRRKALNEVFKSSRVKGYSYSLVDNVIREILKDKNARIDYLVTYNERDFTDICVARKIQIINN